MSYQKQPVPIPFPLSSSPGMVPHESGGRLVNAYAEKLGDTAQSPAVWRRAPGLATWGTTTRTGFRGGIQVAGTLYTAWDGKLEKHSASGGASSAVGNLTGAKKGFFAQNNKSPTPDMVFCDPDGNVTTFTSSTVAGAYPDADLPAPNSVTMLDGYFVFGIGDGRVFASDLNDTAVNALSFAKAEARPDGVVRVVTYADRLVIMGYQTSEVWSDVGASPFPFQRETVIPRGLAGPYAVAGYEDSMSKTLIWVGEDNTVVQLDGYIPVKISPPDLDRAIEGVTDKTTLEACAYMAAGHAFWELSCPAWTWVYDITLKTWFERRAHGYTRSRIVGAFPAFGKWLCGDVASGNVVSVSSAARTDVGNPLAFSVESGPVASFPHRQRLSRVDLNFSVGVGEAAGTEPIQTDPTVEVEWSLDGGDTWLGPVQRKLGQQAKGNTRVSVNNLGTTGPYGPRFRVTVADPVYVGFMGGTLSSDNKVF